MKLNFLINNNYLIAHTLASMGADKFSSKKYQKEIVDFQNFAWKKSEKVYNLLVGRLSPEDFFNIENLAKEILDFFKVLKKGDQYKKVLLRTQTYLLFCEKQWIKNYSTSSKTVSGLTSFKLDKSFTVYITHPSLKNGHYLGNNNICWGHNEDWSNYTTIYLWHEILHSYFDNNDFNHALIQFIADNELRIQLNGGKYPPFVGHEDLFPLMKKVLPHWKRYLKEKQPRDINKFRAKILELKEFAAASSLHPSLKIRKDEEGYGSAQQRKTLL